MVSSLSFILGPMSYGYLCWCQPSRLAAVCSHLLSRQKTKVTMGEKSDRRTSWSDFLSLVTVQLNWLKILFQFNRHKITIRSRRSLCVLSTFSRLRLHHHPSPASPFTPSSILVRRIRTRSDVLSYQPPSLSLSLLAILFYALFFIIPFLRSLSLPPPIL